MSNVQNYTQNYKKIDSFRVRYTILFVSFIIVLQSLELYRSPADSNIHIVVLFVVGLLFLVCYFLFVVAVSLYKKYWRKLLSMLVAPVIAIGLIQVQLYTGFTANYVHFLLGKSRFLDQAMQARGNNPAFYAWLWDRTGGVGITQTRTLLVCDEADQMLLPPEARSVKWKNRVLSFRSSDNLDLRSIADPRLNTLDHTDPSVKKLSEHFYLLTELH